ncbi:MAG TPA: hypothetical protein VHE13_10595 [Opitutus sp.]|nr:hypothetical protein [Opitutus sp.]
MNAVHSRRSPRPVLAWIHRVFAPVLLIAGLVGGGSRPLHAQTVFVSYYDGSNNGYVARGDSGNTSAVYASSFDGAQGLALGSDGYLYVSTPTSFALGTEIARFDPATGDKFDTFVSYVADNALTAPGALTFGSGGKLYVANTTTSSILVYNSDGSPFDTLSDGLLATPGDLAFAAGKLFVTDVGLGNVLSYSAGLFTVVNTSGGALGVPAGLGVGLDGMLYVLDTQGVGTVFQVDPDTGSTNLAFDFSSGSFTPTALTAGADGLLYVGGVDGDGHGKVFQYQTDGSGETLVLDLGFGTTPVHVLTAVPEPAASAAIIGVVLACLVPAIRRRLG